MGKERVICMGKIFIGTTLLSLLSLTLVQATELKKISLDDNLSLGITIVTDTMDWNKLQTSFILQKVAKNQIFSDERSRKIDWQN